MDTKPRLFAFVIMPLSKDFDDVYQLGIKATCKDTGLYCERVDEQIFQETILERIYNQIYKADLIIADMTGRNPNVFYEVGYAHALGKNVILLTRNSEDIPFDLKHYPHIIYNDKIVTLKDELQKRLSWFVNNPEKVEEYFNTNVEIFLDETQIIDNPCVTIPKPDNMANVLYIQINIHNSIEKYIESTSFQVGIISDNSISFHNNGQDVKSYRQKDNKVINILDDTIYIVPNSWEGLSLTLVSTENFKDNYIIALTLRLLFEFGSIDFPFSIKVRF
jgi:nucleoside 2-deoxyribosyltransferase